MRVAVVGLGGVGAYICANLCKTDNEIVGFARGAHLLKIQKSGLQIVEDEKSWIAKVDARDLDESDGYFDLVLFCVKSYDLVEAYKKISPNIDSKSVILSFSNGVNNGDILRELSDSIVLDACIYILCHMQEAGIIRKKGKVFAAVFGGNSDATLKMARLFESANLRCKTPVDIKTAIWKKYIFISAFATITSYYDKSIGYICENHKDEVKTLLQEISAVAKAKGIDISQEITKSLDTASKIPYDSSTSMHLDFKNKKRVELDSLSKFIVDEGQIYGVETTLMQKMYESLKDRI